MRRKAVKPPKPGDQATRRQNGARECLRRRLLEGGHTSGTPFFVHLGGPYGSAVLLRGPTSPGLSCGRSLPTGAGRWLRFFLSPAPSGTDLPSLAAQHQGKIVSLSRSVERRSLKHFIASISVQLHWNRCSACFGTSVHDDWNTHLRREWREGGGPRGMRTSKTRTGRRAGKVCTVRGLA
jgi:hypothetical protein